MNQKVKEKTNFNGFRNAFTRKVPKIMAKKRRERTKRDQWTKINWISICWNESKRDFIVLLLLVFVLGAFHSFDVRGVCMCLCYFEKAKMSDPIKIVYPQTLQVS